MGLSMAGVKENAIPFQSNKTPNDVQIWFDKNIETPANNYIWDGCIFVLIWNHWDYVCGIGVNGVGSYFPQLDITT